jgi:hypothetical protein
MPRELITIQVGQCGNQIGCRFWDRAHREHSAHNPQWVYDDPLSRCDFSQAKVVVRKGQIPGMHIATEINELVVYAKI